MKKIRLIIICSLVFAGVSAQQETHVTQTDYTRHIAKESQYSSQIIVSYSYTLAYPIEEYKSMISRCKELTNKLVEHDKMIQNGSMTKEQTTEWKRDVMEAKLLNYRIDDYTAMYTRENYPLIEYVNKEVLNNYDDFSKILGDATQYAGF